MTTINVAGRGEKDITLVTQHYRPEPIGSGPFLADIAEFMAQRGLTVRVLTCVPHYPTDYAARGIWSDQPRLEVLNGVEVNRLATPDRPDGAPTRKIRAGLQFYALGIAALLTGKVRKTSTVVSLCPSIMSVLLGNACARKGGRHIAVVHDIELGIANGLGMAGKTLTRAIRRVERAALNRCSLVIVLSESMKRQLRQAGVNAPIDVLPVWADTDAILPRPISEGIARTLMYSGNLGRKQGLSQLLDLAEMLQARGADFRLVLRGAGNQAEALVTESAFRGLRNVEFRPLVAQENLCDGLAEGDIHLVPQNPSTADFALPSKIFGIMAAARPFVATATERSPLWQLQRESQAFLCVPPNDARAFCDAILRLASDTELRRSLGARGRDYVLENCSKRSCLNRLASALALSD